MKKTILLCIVMLWYSLSLSAQTVQVFSKTGLLKGTYSTIKAALATTTDGDSLILSAHTFKESQLKPHVYDYIIYQGSISGTDTSTIDAGGNGACFEYCTGTIRDIVLTGAKYISSVSRGGAISTFQSGLITGNTTIRNNEGYYMGAMLINSGKINGHVKIINNKSIGLNLGVIGVYDSCFIEDSVIIAHNIGKLTGAIQGPDGVGVEGRNRKLVISGNVRIFDNYGDSSGAIVLGYGGGSTFQMTGGSISHNTSASGNGAAIRSLYLNAPTVSIDSIVTPNIMLKNVQIYNPSASGKRQNEIYVVFSKKPSILYTEGCWWGNSDTTGLIKVDSGTDFKMPNWAIADWGALPFGFLFSNVRAQMKLNTGAALAANALPGLMANFWASTGYFSAATAYINPSNLLSSDYYFPSSGPYTANACIDADTFRPSTKQLAIVEQGFEQVKVYPNPANDVLHIQGIEVGSSLALYDISGKLLKHEEALSNNLNIDVKDLASGIYQLKISTKDGKEGTAKVMKE